MIGLDTNVVVRYLTQDDKKQAAITNALFEKELSEKNPGFITLITLVEITWVLESCYEQEKANLLAVIASLIAIKQLVIERSDLVYLALKRYESGKADFSDAMIAVIAEDNGCEKIVTFDKKAASIGMDVL